jgi:hypothetical protein
MVPAPEGERVADAVWPDVGTDAEGMDPGPEPTVKNTGIPSGRRLGDGWVPSEAYLKTVWMVLVPGIVTDDGEAEMFMSRYGRGLLPFVINEFTVARLFAPQ